MMKGIDVSHNNGLIDWNKVKSDGIDFAMIRTGFSRTLDTEFHNNMKGAIANEIGIGIWHFSYALTVLDAEAEADYCCNLVKSYSVKPPVFFDFEYDSETYAQKKGISFTKALRTAIHKAFCERVKKNGFTAGIYTNGDYIKSRLNWNELKGYLLWLAQWPLGGDKSIKFTDVKETDVNLSYGKPAIWQIGKAIVSGCKYATDINYGFYTFPRVTVVTPVVTPATIKVKDKVKVVKNVTVTGNIKRGKTYTGGVFRLYYDIYDVLAISGTRVLIGIGSTATAYVNIDDLQKV